VKTRRMPAGLPRDSKEGGPAFHGWRPHLGADKPRKTLTSKRTTKIQLTTLPWPADSAGRRCGCYYWIRGVFEGPCTVIKRLGRDSGFRHHWTNGRAMVAHPKGWEARGQQAARDQGRNPAFWPMLVLNRGAGPPQGRAAKIADSTSCVMGRQISSARSAKPAEIRLTDHLPENPARAKSLRRLLRAHRHGRRGSPRMCRPGKNPGDTRHYEAGGRRRAAGCERRSIAPKKIGQEGRASKGLRKRIAGKGCPSLRRPQAHGGTSGEEGAAEAGRKGGKGAKVGHLSANVSAKGEGQAPKAQVAQSASQRQRAQVSGQGEVAASNAKLALRQSLGRKK